MKKVIYKVNYFVCQNNNQNISNLNWKCIFSKLLHFFLCLHDQLNIFSHASAFFKVCIFRNKVYLIDTFQSIKLKYLYLIRSFFYNLLMCFFIIYIFLCNLSVLFYNLFYNLLFDQKWILYLGACLQPIFQQRCARVMTCV